MIRLDFGQDLSMAEQVIEILFERVLGVQLRRDCYAMFDKNVLPIAIAPAAGIRRPPSG